jgi:ELWxxDGT repeat protein
MPKLLSRAILALALSSALAVPAAAAGFGPYLVADLSHAVLENTSSDPLPVGRAGTTGIFFTNDGTGRLWASDGTPEGTRLLTTSVRPPSPVAETGERLFFTDNVGNLWVTDGTAAGTVRLDGGRYTAAAGRDLWSGRLQLLFFPLYDPAHGSEPWVSDGTPAGTRRLRELQPGSFSSDPTSFRTVGDRVFFIARDSQDRSRLWRTDGTAGGTAVVETGSDARPFLFASTGPKGIFATFGTSALQIWATDGSAGGTVRLADFSGTAGWSLGLLGATTGRVYFYTDEAAAGVRLWTTDGTAAGTRALTRFPAAENSLDRPFAARFLADGTALFFAADGVHGIEPWRSDGTAAGTSLVKDVCPGACGSFSSYSVYYSSPTLVGGRLFAQLFTPQHGAELWLTDGTAAGTREVFDLCPGACSSGLSSFAALGGALLFGGQPTDTGSDELDLWRSDGTPGGTFRLTQGHRKESYASLPGLVVGETLVFASSDGVHGTELWASDGTIAGTRLAGDLVGGEEGGSAPRQITAVGNRVFFVADDPAGEELWVSDGTAGGTVRVGELVPGSDPLPPFGTSHFSRLFGWNGKLFFVLDDGRGPRLWVSDGTPAGTRSLGDSVPLAQKSVFYPLGGKLLFFTLLELWATDGTPAGTVRVADGVGADTGYDGRIPPRVTVLGGRLLFAGSAGGSEGLWQTDGTEAGTGLLKSLPIDSPLVPMGGKVWFIARDSSVGTVLFSTDGTAGGTVPLSVPLPQVEGLAAAAGRLFFKAFDSEHGSELWTSDGTALGTRLVRDILPGQNGASISDLVALGGAAFFVADDGAHGRELWRSDGSEAGTFLVRDIAPGSDAGIPYDATFDPSPRLVVAQGGLLLLAFDPLHGLEPWQSDGTAAGTLPAGDIAPGPLSSQPAELTPAGSLVFLRADDGVRGPELWALCPSPRPAFAVSDVSVREAPGGAVATFTVTLSNAFCADASVAFSTADGTARSGSDYTAAAGTLSFPAGTASRTVEVAVRDDDQGEGNETFSLVLTGAENADIARAGVATILDDDGGGGDDGSLPSEAVACDAARLSGLLARILLTGPAGPGINLSLTASGDFAGMAWGGGGASAPEPQLVFSSNPEETPLLRNPARPQLASVSLTRNALASDLTAGSDLLRLRLDPSLGFGGATDPAGHLVLDNLTGGAGNPTSSRPGRGLAPLLGACHAPFTAADAHALGLLTRLVRATAPLATTAALRLAIYRGEEPGQYRIDVFPVGQGAVGLGRLSAELVTTPAADGALGTGTLRLLGSSNATVPVTLRLVRPAPAGAVWQEGARVGTAPGDPAEQAVDFATLLAGTAWRQPLDANVPLPPAVIDEAAATCEASRLTGFLGRLRAAAPRTAKAAGVNLATTASGDFAGMAYTGNGPGTPEHHLVFSANPEETTLLRNPTRPQLGSLSLTRNPLGSDLVAPGAADELRLTLDPTLGATGTDPAGLLTLDNLTGAAGRSNDAKPGRGLAGLLAPCHRGLTDRDVHVLRVLTQILRGEAGGGTAFEIAVSRAAAPDHYRIDAHLVRPDGTALGLLTAELSVTWTSDGALAGGTLRLLSHDTPGAAAVLLVRPVASGALWPATPYRVGVDAGGNSSPDIAVDWAALLSGTTWRRPL